MKLSDIGKHKNFINIFSNFRGDTFQDTLFLKNKINAFSTFEEAQKGLTLANVSKESAKKALYNSKFSGNSGGIEELLSTLPTAADLAMTTSQKVGNVFSGITQSISSFASTALGQITLVTAGIAGIGMIANAIEGPSYEELQQNSASSNESYIAAQGNIDSAKQRLNEINASITQINNQPLALINQSELSALETAKSELEQTMSLKENLAKAGKDQNALDAAKAMEGKSTSKALNSQLGGFAQKFNESALLQSDNPLARGFRTLTGLDKYKESFEVTDQQAISGDINALNDIKKKRKNLNADIKGQGGKPTDSQKEELEKYTESITELENDLAAKQVNVSERLSRMTDDDGKALKGYESQVISLKDSLNELAHYDTSGMTKQQKQFNSIDEFFNKNSSAGMKDHFTELASSGQMDINAIKSLGLSSDDFGGASLKNVVKYFNDIAQSAKKASEAVTEVDGSLEGVEAAAQSENAGDDFVKMKGYLDQSKKLKEQGLTGTDDFKTVEKMITQGTGKSYDEVYDKLQSYFTTDQNPESEFFGQLTREGIQNFAADFKGLEGTFRTTGEAAHKMGISTEVFEALMGRVQDYEGFDDLNASFNNLVSSSQQLTEAKTNLDGLKSVYDNMKDGDEKKELGANIKEWESQINSAENDLSALPEEVVTTLRFEYDKQQLEELNEDTRAQVENGLSEEDTLAAQAGILANNDLITENIMEQKGISQEDIASDEKLKELQKSIDDDRKELKSGKLDDTKKIETQRSIDEQQQELNEALEDWNPEAIPVPVEPDTSRLEEIFEEITDEEGRQIMMEVFPNEEQAEAAMEKYNEMSLSPKFLELNAEDRATAVLVELQAEELNDKFCELNAEDRATAITNMINDLSLSDKWSSLSAQDQATAILEYYNSLPAEDKAAIITATGGDDTKAKADLASTAIEGIPNAKNTAMSTSGSEIASLQAFSLAGALNSIPRFINTVVSVTSTSAVTPLPGLPGNPFPGKGVANGTAHAGGSWGLKQSGKALINELGREIIVRDGSWFVLNNGYPALATLRSGDIIFNHRQSEEIFRNGYVTGSHASMVGNAHALGTAIPSLRGRAFAGGSEDDFNETFDHIEIWIKRMERALDKLTDSIDKYSYNLSQQNSIADSAMNSIRGNIATLEQSYQTYIDKANSVGLEENWANVVKNGEIRISEITDKDLKERIDDYQDYYEDALDVQEKIEKLQEDLLDLAVQKLDNIDNYFSNRFDYNENFGYETSVSELKEAMDKYTAELNTQIDAGVIVKYSDEWYKAQEQIADYLQDMLEATWNKYEVIIDNLDRIGDNLDDSVSLKEAKGIAPNESDYRKQIDNNDKLIQEYYNLRQSKIQEQDKYDLNSDLYSDLEKEIGDLDSKIFKTLENNEKLKDSIWKVRFETPFEKVIDGLDETIDSTKNLQSLLDDDTFFDKNGGLTGNGLANLALLNQMMAASKQKTAEYTAGLKKLDAAYKSGILSQDEYKESQSDFLKEIQNAAGDVEDYKREIIDMYKDQLEAETEAQQDYYDKRKDSLSLDKEYYEFSKKVSSQSKSINQLKAQIAALQGVNNDSARAELRRLNEELASQEEDLAQTKRDHAYDMQKQGYDALSDGLDTALKDTLYDITMNANRQEQVISDMLGRVVTNYQQAYGVIQGIVSGTGFAGNSGFNGNLTNLGSKAGAAGQVQAGTAGQNTVKPSGTVSGTNTGSITSSPANDKILNEIQKTPDISNRKVAELTLSTSSVTLQEGQNAKVSASVRPTDAQNKTLKWISSDTSVGAVSNGSISAKKAGSATITCSTTDGSGISKSLRLTVTPAPAPEPAPPPPTESTSGSQIPFQNRQDSYPKELLNINSSLVDRLKYHNFDSSMDACRELYSYWGGTGFYSGTYAQNVWLLEKMQSAGYKKGAKSIPETGADFIHEGEIIIRKSDNGMLLPLKRGDGVIPSGLTENLWKLAEHAPEVLNSSMLNLNTAPAVFTVPVSNSQNTEINIENLLKIEGDVASNDMVHKIKAAIPHCAKELAQEISKEFSKDANKIK